MSVCCVNACCTRAAIARTPDRLLPVCGERCAAIAMGLQSPQDSGVTFIGPTIEDEIALAQRRVQEAEREHQVADEAQRAKYEVIDAVKHQIEVEEKRLATALAELKASLERARDDWGEARRVEQAKRSELASEREKLRRLKDRTRVRAPKKPAAAAAAASSGSVAAATPVKRVVTLVPAAAASAPAAVAPRKLGKKPALVPPAPVKAPAPIVLVPIKPTPEAPMVVDDSTQSSNVLLRASAPPAIASDAYKILFKKNRDTLSDTEMEPIEILDAMFSHGDGALRLLLEHAKHTLKLVPHEHGMVPPEAWEYSDLHDVTLEPNIDTAGIAFVLHLIALRNNRAAIKLPYYDNISDFAADVAPYLRGEESGSFGAIEDTMWPALLETLTTEPVAVPRAVVNWYADSVLELFSWDHDAIAEGWADTVATLFSAEDESPLLTDEGCAQLLRLVLALWIASTEQNRERAQLAAHAGIDLMG